MAADPFNSLSGYTVGIPAVSVVDSNGNVVSNFLNLEGNVSANKIYSNSYYYSNGSPFNASAAGSDTQLQFNNAGTFGGIPNATWDGNVLSLGDVQSLSIGGGENGYFLQTDGLGNLTWTAGGGGGGNGSPGGANTQVQFNDAGVFGGDNGFTYNKNTNTLYVENISAGNSSDDTITTAGNLSITGVATAGNIISLGNVIGNYFIGNGSQLTGIQTDVANYVSNPIQANITSLGNLQFLNVDGDIISLGNVGVSGNVVAGNISLSSNVIASNVLVYNRVTVGGNLTINANASMRVSGNINTAGSPNINLGTLSNIRIGGGLNGYVLSTDGLGNLSWTAGGGGGGNGVPAGANMQLQYNNGGSFGASPYLIFDNFTNTLTLAGNLVANTFQMGTGIYHYCTSRVFFSSTNSTTPNQVIYSVPVTFVSSVDFTIIATDAASGTRQTSKISATFYNGEIVYNEYAGLQINGGVGSFSVGYDPGGILNPPSYQLLVTPDSTNLTNYKMMVVEYAE